MVKKDEVILMTKLAIYDKKYGLKDKKANERFYKDYLYIKNFYTRLLVLLGCFIIIFIYIITMLLNDNADYFLLDFRLAGIFIAGFIGIIMLLYTVISTKIHSNDYKNIKKRLKAYFRLMKELENLRDKRLNNNNEQPN